MREKVANGRMRGVLDLVSSLIRPVEHLLPRGGRRNHATVGLRVLAAAFLAAGLAGCGRRGGLEPALDPTASSPAKADDTLVLRRPKAVPITPPHEPFILDPLL